MIWSEERVKNFTRKLVTVSGGRLRYSEEERVVSGEFPIAANMGGAVEQMWQWQAQGAPLMAGIGSTPVLPSYFQLGVPKNSAHPNLAKLFVGFMASKEAQDILDKLDFRSSHLVEETRIAKYLRQNPIKLQEPKDSIAYYLQGEEGGLQLKEELARMVKQYQADEKSPPASLRCDRLAPTYYQSTPPLADHCAPRIWDFFHRPEN